MSSEVRVRFAPSPTGYLHVGGARTALFDYLFARHMNGKFILRIEDTDRSRYQEDALAEIYQSLQWLGLQWDEGPEVGGEYGPYVQSERTDLYREHVQKLLDSGAAYRCFCTAERLSDVREKLQKEKANIGYDRHCRSLSKEQEEQYLAEGKPHVVRLKIPLGETIAFTDMIRENIEYQSDILDDLILMKSDGFPTYHLASVVDDYSMKISHVFRGEEWIASTPSHILLYRAFGWEAPVFAHLPVILSPDGGKLSKRKGAASVMDYKNAGYLPGALFNFLALLGWNPGDDREKMSYDEIVSAFSLERVSPKSAVFDEQKLEWMNGLYLAEQDNEVLFPEVKQLLCEEGIDSDAVSSDYLHTVISLLKTRSKKLTDLVKSSMYFFNDPDQYDEKTAKKRFKTTTADTLEAFIPTLENTDDFSASNLETVYKSYAESNEIGAGKIIHPTRLAVSGVGFGPGLYEMLETIGKEAVIRRLKKAVQWLRINRKAEERGR